MGAFKVKIVERQGGLIFEAFKTTVDQSLTNLSKFVASRHREKKRVTATKDVGSCRDQKRDQRMWVRSISKFYLFLKIDLPEVLNKIGGWYKHGGLRVSKKE